MHCVQMRFRPAFYRSGQIQYLNTGILKCLRSDFRNVGKIELRQRLTTVKSRGGQRFPSFQTAAPATKDEQP